VLATADTGTSTHRFRFTIQETTAMTTHTWFTLSAAAVLSATPAPAQTAQVAQSSTARDTTQVVREATSTPARPADSTAAPAAAKRATSLLVPQTQIQRLRPNDQRGINVFEAPKEDAVPFAGFQLGFGAAFTQQFQGLGHSNSAEAVMKTTSAGQPYNANELIRIGHGANNAVANGYLNAQLAPGIRVALTAYLSARHHNETWVKDGYLLVDESPLDFGPLAALMRYTTVKAGHFEVNYGDAHFRRTDNGQAMFNPLVGNYLLDAFTTSVGAEVMVRPRGRAAGLFLMGGATNGEVRGTVLNPQKRSPAFLAKAGVDRQLTRDLRVRLSASAFNQASSANQTLFTGDRAGSRYYDVLENTQSTEKDQAWSGAVNPGLSSEMHAAVVNPFLKYRGLELFGNFERARGRAAGEAAQREWRQSVVEGTYRFLGDRLYASARYNAVTGRPAGLAEDVSVDRAQFGGGWFITPVVLVKGEYVTQEYADFPTTDIRSGGKFDGFMIEGVVAF
jgi:hypothetical protein